MIRAEVTFPVRSESCVATLHAPDSGARVPCVVLGHGFSSTRSEGLHDYAARFASAGFAALVFDYRHFGDSPGEPRQLLSIKRQLQDYRAAVEFARTRSEVDPQRVALWGTSLSGGHVLRIAAQDHAIAAVIAQTPFTSGAAAARAAELKNVVRGTAYGIADGFRALARADPILVPAIGRPGSFAAITEPGALEAQQRLAGEGSRWRNEVAARAALPLTAYRPAAKAHRIQCPLLVCVATADATTPAQPAIRVAERAPRGELREYACGHFDIYDGEWFERMAGDEIEFLERHLGRRRR